MEQNNEELEPQKKSKAGITADGISFAVIFFAIVLLPIFFLPMSNLSGDITKSAFFSLLVAVSFLFWLIGRLRDGRFVFPRSNLLLALGIIPFVFLVSAVFSAVPKVSFWGVQYEIGTFLIASVLAIAAFLVAVFFQTRERIFTLYAWLIGGSFVAFIFLLIGFLSARGILPSFFTTYLPANLVGKWSDLAGFFGFTAVISFITLEFIPLRKYFKAVTVTALSLSMLVLILVNSSLLWTILGVVAFVAFVYAISFGQNTSKEKISGRKIPAFSLGVLLLSILFVLAGSPLNSFLTNTVHTNIPQEVVRPTWQTTFTLAKSEYKKSPLFGAGPNRFQSVWTNYRPLGINVTDAWNVDFDSSVGVVPTFGVTLGALGLIAWLLFIVCFIAVGAKSLMRINMDRTSRYLLASSFFSAAYLWAIAIFYVPNIVVYGLAFIATGIFIAALVEGGVAKNFNFSFLKDPRAGFASVLTITALIVLTLFGGYIIFAQFIALRSFEAGTELAVQGDVLGARNAFENAINIRESDLAYRALSQVEIGSLNVILNQQNLSQDTIKAQFQEASSAAIDNALKATQFDSTNYLNWLSLAQAYQAMIPFGAGTDFYDNAKKAFAEAQTLNPNDPEIALDSAQLEISNKNIPGAKADLVRALSLKNNYVDAILLYAQIQASEGDVAQAILSTQVATQIDPNNMSTFFQLGYLKYQNNDFAGAIPALERVLELSPNYSNAKYFLGLSYSKVGRTADAIQQFQEVEAMNPGNTDVQTILKNLQTKGSVTVGTTSVKKLK